MSKLIFCGLDQLAKDAVALMRKGDLNVFWDYMILEASTREAEPVAAEWIQNTKDGIAWAQSYKRDHYWSFCGCCGPMVTCGTCGNASCNCGQGRLPRGTFIGSSDGTPCPDCPSSWAKRQNEDPPPEVLAMANDPGILEMRRQMYSAAVPSDYASEDDLAGMFGDANDE